MQVDRDMYLSEPPYEEIPQEELKKQNEYDCMKKCISLIKEEINDDGIYNPIQIKKDIKNFIKELEDEINIEF